MSCDLEVEKLREELNAAHEAHKQEVEMLKKSLQEHIQCERLRKNMESINGKLTAEIERLKQRHARETQQFTTVLTKVNCDLVRTDSELQKVRRERDTYLPRLDESFRAIEALHHELSTTKNSATELKQRLDIQSKELQSAQEESSALKTLLKDRTSELKGAQSFLTTADALSGAEVTSTLQKLNVEVLQSTAFMAESMVELFLRETAIQVFKTDEQLAASKRASDAIGGVIVHFLGTKEHTDNPVLIQIAFQACLMRHLRWVARAWVIGGDEGHNRFIDEIYQSMHEKEAQAIAGRWRALTRVYVPSTSFDNSQIAFQMVNKIISDLSDILLIAGSTAQKLDVASAFSSKFADKLSFLVSCGMRVNKIIGEDVTSGDLEVMAIRPTAAFDVRTMEDSYDDGRSGKGRENNIPRVLCATDLGLRKRTRVGTSGKAQWKTKVLLKPKVALESVIDNLDERATCG